MDAGAPTEKTAAGRKPGRSALSTPMPKEPMRVWRSWKATPMQARRAVVVIEAMKMENELRAARDGVVAEMHVVEGQSVDAGALLAVIA